MKSPAVDIKDILESVGIGIFAIDLFVSKTPDEPDACVTVYDTGGFAPEAGFDSNYVYDKPTVQVMVRGPVGDYEAGYNRAATIKSVLHDLHGQSWGAAWYIGIWAMSDIIFLGYDDKNRPTFSVNFRIHRTDTNQ